ncbi:MAG: response regulator [Abitibacteriaceae bacterium]|nr:response regulator [Abditibacteriaceae bacterium]
MRILLEDDQLDTRQLYSLMFRLEGHATTLAESGEAAIQAAAEQAFDVILMDAEMHGMNGFTAIKRIRALPQGEKVPIILFTAYSHTEAETHAAGADLLVRKPILLRDLLEKIKQVRQ